MLVIPGTLEVAMEPADKAVAALVPRIWDKDHTVWQDDPTEVANRLGWLDCPSTYAGKAQEYAELAAAVRADGIEHVLLVGMGGSSLYPEVLAAAVAEGDGLSLEVLDTTHPNAVERVRERFDPATWLVVAASKSGTTIETRSHLERFWADLVDALGEDAAGDHVIAITDPGSEFVRLGEERGFRAVIENDPDIGGRFSALSAFGLVPAALLGIDVAAHLEPAAEVAQLARDTDLEDNTPARLGALLGAAAQDGRTQLTVLLPEDLLPFGAWVEQLVAESTGKHNVGLLPIVDEPPLEPGAYGDRRIVVAYGDRPNLAEIADAGTPVIRLPAPAPAEIAAEVFRWEFATAVLGAQLGINPFDQPDVQAAKSATSEMLEQGDVDLTPEPAAPLLEQVGTADHVALLAYVDPGGEQAARLPQVAASLRSRLGVPVTVGIGPRYLHSTGQWHKGGPDLGVHAIVVEEPTTDVEIPGRDFTFRQLLRAQAAGDLAALRDRQRRVALVTLDDLAG